LSTFRPAGNVSAQFGFESAEERIASHERQLVEHKHAEFDCARLSPVTRRCFKTRTKWFGGRNFWIGNAIIGCWTTCRWSAPCCHCEVGGKAMQR